MLSEIENGLLNRYLFPKNGQFMALAYCLALDQCGIHDDVDEPDFIMCEKIDPWLKNLKKKKKMVIF